MLIAKGRGLVFDDIDVLQNIKGATISYDIESPENKIVLRKVEKQKSKRRKTPSPEMPDADRR